MKALYTILLISFLPAFTIAQNYHPLHYMRVDNIIGQWNDHAVVSTYTSPDEIWISDGSEEGTRQILEFPQGSVEFVSFVSMADAFFLSIKQNDHYGLWQYKDSEMSLIHSSPLGLFDLHYLLDAVYFVEYGEPNSIMKINVEDDSIEEIFSFPTFPASSPAVSHLTVFDNQVIFFGPNENNKHSLYTYNSSTDSIDEIIALEESSSSGSLFSSTAACFTEGDGKLFFFSKRRLYVTDGSAQGTEFVVSDVECVLEENKPTSKQSAYANGHFFFRGFDPDTGEEMYVSDGTAEGTGLLMDINEGWLDTNPTNFTVMNDILYFIGNSIQDGQFDEELEIWATDGTEEGTFRPFLYEFNGRNYGHWLTKFEDRIVFVGESSIGEQIFASDGSQWGTEMLTSAVENGNWLEFGPAHLLPVQDKLFFSAKVDSLAFDDHLWVYSNEMVGTEQLDQKEGPMLFPNPAQDVLHISFSDHAFDRVMVYDLFGRMVLEVHGLDPVSIDVSTLVSGTYLLATSFNGRLVDSGSFAVIR